MDLALLILRLVVGLLFVGHGAQKLFGIWGGHGLAGTAGFFDAIGLRPGRMHAPAAGAAELGGGALIALGLLTPVGSALVIAVMVAAALTVHITNGLWATENGIELTLVYAATAFALAGVGPGAWSLDNAFGLDMAGTGWALGALGLGIIGGVGAVLSGRMVAQRQPTAAATAAPSGQQQADTLR
jgi:putative oxidoreductase